MNKPSKTQAFKLLRDNTVLSEHIRQQLLNYFYTSPKNPCFEKARDYLLKRASKLKSKGELQYIMVTEGIECICDGNAMIWRKTELSDGLYTQVYDRVGDLERIAPLVIIREARKSLQTVTLPDKLPSYTTGDTLELGGFKFPLERIETLVRLGIKTADIQDCSTTSWNTANIYGTGFVICSHQAKKQKQDS